MRGAGNSDGLMQDEYTPREWADAVEVIAWIAHQPWCSGEVGMIGLSWSGFNALQIAALAPPALKAIVTTGASDDRYGDDMHYMGGALLNNNCNMGRRCSPGSPPRPIPRSSASAGGRCGRRAWRVSSPPAARWMAHGDRDEYWQSGSVCEDYSKIKAAVLAVGGWADGYVNAVLRLLRGLPGPQGADRPLGPCLPPCRHTGTPDRFHRLCPALVRPLAEATGQRADGRADADRLDAARASRRGRATGSGAAAGSPSRSGRARRSPIGSCIWRRGPWPRRRPRSR